ncbi:hypothetical protein F4823DRAFT_561334 [Ustulina deusta]|nr:hypothetical protein F4823DRAFT_561334 [Ustulina deusta]
MSSRFKWFLSAFTLVLSGVISVYDNYVDAISKMASEGRKTELSEKPQTNAAIVAEEGEREGEEKTLDSGPKQDDGWEKVSEAADNGGNWNDFEDDYYSSGDDITMEEYIENGEWLHLDYRKVSDEQPLPASPAEEIKEEVVVPPSSETKPPAKDRVRERAKPQRQAPQPISPSRMRRYNPRPPPFRPLQRETEMLAETTANGKEAAVSGSSNSVHSKEVQAVSLPEGCQPRPQAPKPQAAALVHLHELSGDLKTFHAHIEARTAPVRKRVNDLTLQSNPLEPSPRNMTFFEPYRYYTY